MKSPPPRAAPGTEDLERTSHEGLVEPVRIEAVDGPGAGAAHVLLAGTLVVGSSDGCGLTLRDGSVSRRHLEIQLLGGSLKVRDLGSRNGSVYLGARIHEALVPVGGSVRVGRTTLRFAPERGARPPTVRSEFFGLIGGSAPMRALYDVLERLAPLDVPVLVVGETGTGKDAVARALHAASARAEAPLVVFDCAGVNAQLVESELFGHARGAFTGAVAARAGALERALEGTLLLDEVGELPLELQPRLLRALEAREFKRVGENGNRRFRARVVAATHRDLEARIGQGLFRQDLYFRLAGAVVRVPPLRERPEDIPDLAQAFARAQLGGRLELDPTTVAALQCDPWPGNVRELRNAVARAMALGRDAAHAPTAARAASFKAAREQLLAAFERDFLRSLLARHSGNVSAAARESKLSRRQFYRLLDKHGLEAHD